MANKKVVCQACGAVCVPQSEEMMGGRDDLYACPNGHTSGLYEDEEGRIYQGYWPVNGDMLIEVDVDDPVCPVCGKPFPQPVGCEELEVVDLKTGHALFMPEWYAEHEECKTVWAGMLARDGRGRLPGKVYRHAAVRLAWEE